MIQYSFIIETVFEIIGVSLLHNHKLKQAQSYEKRTYRLGDKQKFSRACALAQSRQNIRSSQIQSEIVYTSSYYKLDI